jgi:hypothetical protein
MGPCRHQKRKARRPYSLLAAACNLRTDLRCPNPDNFAGEELGSSVPLIKSVNTTARSLGLRNLTNAPMADRLRTVQGVDELEGAALIM